MNNRLLQAISDELSTLLPERRVGKIFQIAARRIIFDLRPFTGSYLLISIETSAPRIHLIRTKLRDLEKLSKNPHPFTVSLRKAFANAQIEKISKLPDERVLKIDLATITDFGENRKLDLIVQLTGRSSNIFLTDRNGIILSSLADTHGAGQEIGTIYSPPQNAARAITERTFELPNAPTLSERLELFYDERERAETRAAAAKQMRMGASDRLKKLRKLAKNLTNDLLQHGEAPIWKRYGDLLLANIATAKISADAAEVIDYFDENTPNISIELEQGESLNEAAERYFKRYTKARNAKAEIEQRLEKINSEIISAETELAKIEEKIAGEDLIDFSSADRNTAKTPERSDKKRSETDKHARRFISSDGWTILVGKASKDNDYLTFKIAKSLDYWLHAADYPGSHVVVQNQNRAEIPQKTLLEAAKLAAFYSQAKSHPKAAVNYTQKKFVTKPKGAAAGLVRLSSFKTLLVEPEVTAERAEV